MTFVEAMRILAAFERHSVAYVLVGSMAMAAQGIVRATRDIDIFVEGISVRVATPRMLFRMKRDTVRLQDRADAELLKQRFGLGDD